MSSNPATSRNAPTTWRSFILSLYPDALLRTYCVPPEHFNRVPYDRDTVPGTGLSALVLPVPVTPPVQNVPPVSQPSGSASQPSGSAAPVQNVPRSVSHLVVPHLSKMSPRSVSHLVVPYLSKMPPTGSVSW